MRCILLAALLLFTACEPEEECCYEDSHLANITFYSVKANRHTPNGIGLDDPLNPEHVLDAAEIDRKMDAFEACLNKNFLNNPYVVEENGHCLRTNFEDGISIKRHCLTIKVPDDLYKSKCSDEWLFPCDVDDQYCLAKGIVPTEECPCSCRATVQDNNNLITNHVLNVLWGELARVVTTCNNPWVVPQIQGCLSDSSLKASMPR
jgi:hypothetical protein